MSDFFDKIRAAIPANKFYPPLLNIDGVVLRENLLNVIHKKRVPPQVLLIEAQAGQGKTTFAIQFLEEEKRPHAWFQVGPEDQDPILFLATILACIKKQECDFHCELLERMLANGEINAVELPRLVNILLQDLGTFLEGDFYLVFDDLHIIKDMPHSLGLLNLMLSTAPQQLHFILISRQPMMLGGKNIKYGHNSLTVSNKQLAFSEKESVELVNDAMGIKAPLKTIRKLRRITAGWAMGLSLFARDLEHIADQDDDRIIHTDIQSYFQEEIIQHIPPESYNNLLTLALLDDIPVDLAVKITGDPAIVGQLAGLNRQNFFVRSLDKNCLLFSFHHLFRDFLRQQAEEELSASQISNIFRNIAAYYLKDKPLTALQYFLKAADYDAMERLLKTDGSRFIAENKGVTLGGILQQTPAKVIMAHAWISLFIGISIHETAPEQSINMLEAALGIFSARQDQHGRLLALSQIIYFHFTASGLHAVGALYLEETESIFLEIQPELSAFEQVMVAKDLATGFLFFTFDLTRSRKYSTMAIQTANHRHIDNFLAASQFVRCYEYQLAGLQKLSHGEMEKSQHMINDPAVGIISKLSLLAMQINALEMHGDFENFFSHSAKLVRFIGKELIEQTIVGPYLFVWRISVMISQGLLTEASKLLTAKLEEENKANCHVTTQMFYWQAFILGQQGKNKEAITLIDSCRKKQIDPGGVYYSVMDNIITAIILAEIPGSWKDAEATFAHALETSRRLKMIYQTAAAYLQRAYCRLRHGETNMALADISEGLAIMRENQFVHFRSWTPAMMTVVLQAAVKNNIEVDYARELARQRLNLTIRDDGTIIPLLQIKFLADLQLCQHGEPILKSVDFTPAQRQLIGMLIAAPNQSTSQEKIQLNLWPESPPDKARAKLDTLLSRLRKTLNKALTPAKASDYLNLQKGLLFLDNHWIDAEEFSAKARLGLRHASQDDYWQATNYFYPALKLWSGSSPPQAICDEGHNYTGQLERLFIESSLTWSAGLAKIGRTEEAIEILEEASRHENTNDMIFKSLYQYYIANNAPLRAKETLAKYKHNLKANDFSSEEIDEYAAIVSG